MNEGLIVAGIIGVLIFITIALVYIFPPLALISLAVYFVFVIFRLVR